MLIEVDGLAVAGRSDTAIASATAASAAATVMHEDATKTCPASGASPPAKAPPKRENARKREVDAVEHQLDAHQHADRVALAQSATAIPTPKIIAPTVR